MSLNLISLVSASVSALLQAVFRFFIALDGPATKQTDWTVWSIPDSSETIM